MTNKNKRGRPRKKILVNQTEAAKLAGVTRQTMQDLKNGSYNFWHGNKIDVNCTEWLRYMQDREMRDKLGLKQKSDKARSHKVKITESENRPQPSYDGLAPAEDLPDIDNVDDFQRGVLIDMVARARAMKAIEDAKRASYTRKELEGKLIDFKIAEKIMYDYLDESNRKLLELGTSLVDRIIEYVEASGKDARHDIITLVTDEVENILQSTRTQILKKIENYMED